MAYVEDVEHQELHEPTSFYAKYVWSQDHKVIAIQYYAYGYCCGSSGVGSLGHDAYADWGFQVVLIWTLLAIIRP